jgi:hypothetical protein
MLYTIAKTRHQSDNETKRGEAPNVQIMKLSNQKLPYGNDFNSSITNIFTKMCFLKNYVLPSLPNTFYIIFDEGTSINFEFFRLKKSKKFMYL